MSRAERRAAENEMYTRHFETAFRILDKEKSHGWLNPAEVSPVAALQNDVFMARHRLMSDLKLVLSFGMRQPQDIPSAQDYPPNKTISPILNILIEEGVIERIEPEAMAAGLVTHPRYLAPMYDGYLYRLALEEPAAEPQSDVAITA